MRTGEVSESTFMMLRSTLMPSIEEVVKLSLLPEEISTLASSQPRQNSKSQSSWLKSKLQMMPSGQFINALPKEEVLSSVRSQSVAHPLSRWRPTCQSESHLVSPKHSEQLPQEELSHNACSIIGKKWLEIHAKKAQRPTRLSRPSEAERASSQASPLLRTSLINSEPRKGREFYFAYTYFGFKLLKFIYVF